MSDESELIILKEGLRRSRRRASLGFVILVLALVLCMLYAFVQQFAATKNAEEALRQHELVELSMQEANKQRAIAIEQRAAAEMAQAKAVAAMEECAKRLNAKSKGK